MKQIKSILLVFLTLVSCARVQTLNMKPHSYSTAPDLIVWYYVAGLHADQIPLIKFNAQQTDFKTWFDDVDCNGKMFNYNLYQLRPDSNKSFLAQLLGSKNITNKCEDFDRTSFVGKMNKNYQFYMVESGIKNENSLDRFATCGGEIQNEIASLRLFKMTSSPYDKDYFHYQDKSETSDKFINPGVYYDRACQSGTCYSSTFNNIKLVYNYISKGNQPAVLVIRDASYLNALVKKDLNLAREKLFEIDQTLKWLSSNNQFKSLIVLSAGESINVEFPTEGKSWEEFVKSGKGFTFKNSTLSSPVFAKGALAENFCGNFEESEFLNRISTKALNKKLNWDVINPFN